MITSKNVLQEKYRINKITTELNKIYHLPILLHVVPIIEYEAGNDYNVNTVSEALIPDKSLTTNMILDKNMTPELLANDISFKYPAYIENIVYSGNSKLILSVAKTRQLMDSVFVDFDVEEITGNASTILAENIGTLETQLVEANADIASIFQPSWVVSPKILDYSVVGSKLSSSIVLPANTAILTSGFTTLRPVTTSYFYGELAALRGTTQPFLLNTIPKLAAAIDTMQYVNFSDYISVADFKTRVETLPFRTMNSVWNNYNTITALHNSVYTTAMNRFQSVAQYQSNILWSLGYTANALGLAMSIIGPRFSSVETKYAYVEDKRALLKNEVYSPGWVTSARFASSLELSTQTALPNSVINLSDSSEKVTTTMHVKNMLNRDIYGNIEVLRTIQKLSAMLNSDASFAYNVTAQVGQLNTQIADASLVITHLPSGISRESVLGTIKTNIQTQRQHIQTIDNNYKQYDTLTDMSMQWLLSQTALQSMASYGMQSSAVLEDNSQKLDISAFYSLASKYDTSFSSVEQGIRTGADNFDQASVAISTQLDGEVGRLSLELDSSLSALYVWKGLNTYGGAATRIGGVIMDISDALYDASMSVEGVRQFSADASVSFVETAMAETMADISAGYLLMDISLNKIDEIERNVVTTCDASLGLIEFPSLDSFHTLFNTTSQQFESYYRDVRFINDLSLIWLPLYVDAYNTYFKGRYNVWDISMALLRENVGANLSQKIGETDARIIEPSFNDMILKHRGEKIDNSLNSLFTREIPLLNNSVWNLDLSARDSSLAGILPKIDTHDGSLSSVETKQWDSIGGMAGIVLPEGTTIVESSSNILATTSLFKKGIAGVVGISPDSLNSIIEMYHAIGTSIHLPSVFSVFEDISSNLTTQNGRLDGLSSAGLQEFDVDASINLLETGFNGLDLSAVNLDTNILSLAERSDGSLSRITELLVLPDSWVSSVDSSLQVLLQKTYSMLPGFDSSYGTIFERNRQQKNNVESIQQAVSTIFPAGYFDRFDLSGIHVPTTAALESRADSSLAFLGGKYGELDSSLSSVENTVKTHLVNQLATVNVTNYSDWVTETQNVLSTISTDYDSSYGVVNNSLVNNVASYYVNQGNITTYAEEKTRLVSDSSAVDASVNYFLNDARIASMNSSVVLPEGVEISPGVTEDPARPQTTGTVKKTVVGIIKNAPVALNSIGKLAAALSDPDLQNTVDARLSTIDTSLNLFNYTGVIQSLDASFTQLLPLIRDATSAFQQAHVNDVSTNLAETQLTSVNTKVESGWQLSLNSENKIGTTTSIFGIADTSIVSISDTFNIQENSCASITSVITSVETVGGELHTKLASNDLSTNTLLNGFGQRETSIHDLFNLFTKPYGVVGVATVDSITVSFQQPMAADALSVSSYRIYVSGGGNANVYTVANTVSSYLVTGLTQDTAYTIYVEAVTEYINTSTPSIVVTTPMGGISGLNATANTTTSISVAYTLNTGAESYSWTAVPDLVGAPTRSGTVSGSTNTITIGSLTAGAVYTISVVANGALGSSTPSTITYGTKLAAPAISATANSDTSITVSVTGPSVGTVVKYTWSAAANGFPTKTGELDAGTTSGVLVGLDAGVVYIISVVAVGLYGNSAAGTTNYGTRLAAPGGLTVTENTTTSISISYVAPAVGTITKYTWTAVPDVGVETLTGDLSANLTSTTITGMTSGAIYTISLLAVGTYGSSNTAQTVYGTRLSAPSGLTATSTTSSITVSYSMPVLTQQNIEKFVYEVYQGATLIETGDISANVFTKTITGLTTATDYTVGVYAMNLYGNSATSSSIVGTAAEAPSGLTGTASTSTSITISFVRPSGTFTRFDWKARPTLGGTTLTGNFVTAGNTGTISGLTSAVEYGISIAAIGTYSSAYSSEVIYGTAPAAPTELTYVARDVSSISLSWTAVSGVTSYTAGARSVTLGTVTTKTSATNSIVMDGLNAGRIYDISVAAVGTYGTGGYSNVVRNSTRLVVPPSLTATNINATGMTITYDALVAQDCSFIMRTVPNVNQYILVAGSGSRTLSGLTTGIDYTIYLDASNIYAQKETVSTIAKPTNPPLYIKLTSPTGAIVTPDTTTVSGRTIFSFTSTTGTNSIDFSGNTNGLDVRILTVGGGGGGGYVATFNSSSFTSNGGGGGGGLVEEFELTPSTSYNFKLTFTIGAGGVNANGGKTECVLNTNGNSSLVLFNGNLTNIFGSEGGGLGAGSANLASYTTNYSTAGGPGGGGTNYQTGNIASADGAGTLPYFNRRGGASVYSDRSYGGGGGAGSIGTALGNGGNAQLLSGVGIGGNGGGGKTPTTMYFPNTQYGSGGGGGGGTPGLGASGAGKGQGSSSAATNGLTGRGGGGGGASSRYLYYTGSSGNGGSGIAIVSIPNPIPNSIPIVYL